MPSSSIELSQYGETSVSSTSRADDALLSSHSEHTGGVEEFTKPYIPSPTSPYRQKRRPSTLSRLLGRLWRPLLCIFTPIALVFIYGLINPHIPALPPLPTVSISHGSSTLSSGLAGTGCECGSRNLKGDAKRICDVYGKEALERSRLFDGSGGRVRRVLTQAKSEKRALKVGILGGSISACHGLHPSPEYPQGHPQGPGCYTTLFREWLNTAFPLEEGMEHEIMNGAIGGVDSSYYAFCGTHHIPTDVDLIILEFDVNDQASHLYQSFFDQLLRVLLEFPSQPAIIILGAWSPLVALDQGYGDPQIVHLPISHYYDVPYVSLKRLVWNHYLRWPKSTTETFWLWDGVHPNSRGHRVLADLLISYLENQICYAKTIGLPQLDSIDLTIATEDTFSILIDTSTPYESLELFDPANPPPGWEDSFNKNTMDKIGWETKTFVSPLSPYAPPLIPLFQPLRDVVDPTKQDPSDASFILGLIQPKVFCADANDPEHPMIPASADGWSQYSWNDEKHYWVSETVGAKIRVDIKVSQGRIAVYYFRSQKYDLGDAQCWVDDNEKGAVRLPGWWKRAYNVASVAYIDEKVTPGDHYVTCEIIPETSHPSNPKAHHFRIVAIMAT